jgi:hypothetical protein
MYGIYYLYLFTVYLFLLEVRIDNKNKSIFTTGPEPRARIRFWLLLGQNYTVPAVLVPIPQHWCRVEATVILCTVDDRILYIVVIKSYFPTLLPKCVFSLFLR